MKAKFLLAITIFLFSIPAFADPPEPGRVMSILYGPLNVAFLSDYPVRIMKNDYETNINYGLEVIMDPAPNDRSIEFPLNRIIPRLTDNSHENLYLLDFYRTRDTRDEKIQYLHWRDNTCLYMNLTKSPYLFFTATLQGCYLAFKGDPERRRRGPGLDPDSSPLVVHISLLSTDEEMERVTKLRNYLIRSSKTENENIYKDFFLLTKADYYPEFLADNRSLDYYMTVFGIQKSSAWTFYYQRVVYNLNVREENMLLLESGTLRMDDRVDRIYGTKSVRLDNFNRKIEDQYQIFEREASLED